MNLNAFLKFDKIGKFWRLLKQEMTNSHSVGPAGALMVTILYMEMISLHGDGLKVIHSAIKREARVWLTSALQQ